MQSSDKGNDNGCTTNALTEWLQIATKKLIAPAQERIQKEIETHYAEAVAAHLVAGQSEADAQANALQELGDAKQAGKRFRRLYLTEHEAKRYTTLGGRWYLLLPSHYLIFLCYLVPFLFLFHGVAGVIPRAVPAFLLAVVGPTWTSFLIKRKGIRAGRRAWFLATFWNTYPECLFNPLVFSAPGLTDKSHLSLYIAIFLTTFVPFLVIAIYYASRTSRRITASFQKATD